MTEKLLANWSEADGIPRSIALTVASYAALVATTAFPGKSALDVNDLEKLVLLSDCKQVWRLMSFSPPVWDLDDEGPADHLADFVTTVALTTLTDLPSSTFDVGTGVLAAGKRVLAYKQGTYVGIFILAANGANWDLSRAPDLVADGQVSGASVLVRYSAIGRLYAQTGSSLSTLSYARMIAEGDPRLLGDSISAPVIAANGATGAVVDLTTNNWTNLLPVEFDELGLAPSSVYLATVTFTCYIRKTATAAPSGAFRLVTDLNVRTNQFGGVYCSFPADAKGNSSPLIGTPFEGAELDIIRSDNGVTLRVTRPAGLACTVSAEWVTNSFRRMGDAPDYPKVGIWGVGGSWIADDAVLSGNSVVSIAARESGIVLSPSGGVFTSELDPLTNTRVLVGDKVGRLVGTSALLNGFDGVRTPNLVYVQFTSAHVKSSNWILELTDADNGSRVIQINWAYRNEYGDTYGGYRVEAATSTINACSALALDARIVLIFCLHTDGKLYIVSPAGVSDGVLDVTTPGLTSINTVRAGQSGDKLRRWGMCLSDNPLADAVEIYDELVTMP